MNKSYRYKAYILFQLYNNKILSIGQLADTLNKSISLTTKFLLELVSIGLVEEAGLAESSGGRKPILYKLKQDAFYILSVSMDQFSVRIGMLDLSNNPILPIQTNIINLAFDQNAASLIHQLIHDYIINSHVPLEKIKGIGLAMPGFIDSKEGISYSLATKNQKEKFIVKYLQEKLNIPVHIDNDSSLIALAEHRFGLAKETNNAMVVNFGWGIGLGIVSDGKLYRGENGFAGEFSHIPMFNNNKICSCGKIGCLETETSFSFLIEKVDKEIENGRPSILAGKLHKDLANENSDIFFKAIDDGDLLATEILAEACYNIGRGIAILIHIFNPKKVIISGKGAIAGDILLPPIQQAINEHCIKRLSSNIQLEISHMKQNAELIGAACLVIDHVTDAQIK